MSPASADRFSAPLSAQVIAFAENYSQLRLSIGDAMRLHPDHFQERFPNLHSSCLNFDWKKAKNSL